VLIIAIVLITLGLAVPYLKDYILQKDTVEVLPSSKTPVKVEDPEAFWVTDFNGNRVIGVDYDSGEIKWEQYMKGAPIPRTSWYNNTEYVTIAPNGNLIVINGDGMIVMELDRKTHKIVWQYGRTGLQSYRGGLLHEPDKAYKFNDHEVVINDGNNRRVIIVDQKTDQVVWQYGEYMKMSAAPGYLRGNTSVVPINDGKQFIITDTLEKKIMIIDRATKNIEWEWKKEDAKWLEHVFPTKQNTFVLEDRQRNEVFEINRKGEILWKLETLADGTNLSYPTDTAKLDSGNILIAEAGKGRVIEVVPQTGEVVREFGPLGFVTTIAVDKYGIYN